MSMENFFGPALPPSLSVPSSDNDLDEMCKHSTEQSTKRNVSRDTEDSSGSSSRQSSSESDSSSDIDTPSAKRSRQDSSSTVRPVMGPALPPESSPVIVSNAGGFIGPVIPPSALETSESNAYDEDDLVGPLPDADGRCKSYSALDELESRARHMKDKLLGRDLPDPASLIAKREEWMTELPPELVKNFGVTARTFSTKIVTAADKDRSGWTETPADRARKQQQLLDGTPEPEPVKSTVSATDNFQMAADASYRHEVDQYNKLARPKSLLELHSEKLHKSHHSKKKKKKNKKDSKEKKKKKKKHDSKDNDKDSDSEKKKKKKKSKEEIKPRIPFDREKDLQLTRMDDSKRKSVIQRSNELGGRFGHGSLQFL